MTMEGESNIFETTKLFTCDNISLSAFSQNGRKELLALILGNGDIVYYYFTEDLPIVKTVPWLRDKIHKPVAATFNPSGTFLLLISKSGHIYIVPALSVVDNSFSSDQTFYLDDITIIQYPYMRRRSSTVKIPRNASENSLTLSKSSSLSVKSNCSNHTSETKNIIKNIMFSNRSNEILFSTCVVWWQSITEGQQYCIVGNKTGEILFVDLVVGCLVGSTCVRGEIIELQLCQDNSLDTVFLLITTENNEQYKLMLEQKSSNYHFIGGSTDPKTTNTDQLESLNLVETSVKSSSSYLPSARARLQGLKQLSVEKLTNLKQKISETRSKNNNKQGSSDEGVKTTSGTNSCPNQPENLNSVLGDTYLSSQYARGRYVLTGYHPPTQLLTVHSMSVDIVPLFIYMLPVDSGDVVLCDVMMFVLSKDRNSLQVVSTHLAEARIGAESEFNQESILGKWSLKTETKEKVESKEKPDLIPTNGADTLEKIIKIYKNCSKQRKYDVFEEFNLEKNSKLNIDSANIDSCIVTTNRSVYVVQLRTHIVKYSLDLILTKEKIDECESICKVFCINLQNLLEVAGDIELSRLNFDKAVQLFKLSKCGHLKSVVKLSCGGHCGQVLSYSSALLSSNMQEMSLTERIHLSNLVLMAYTQQLLKSEYKDKLAKLFLEFLEKNTYYDEILAVSVTGQSYLFKHLYKLLTKRGLTANTFSVLRKIMKRMVNVKTLNSLILNEDSWLCMTDCNLVEAMIADHTNISIYIDFLLRFIDDLDVFYIDRMLTMFNPNSGWLRNIFKFAAANVNNDDEETALPAQKILHTFLTCLLLKLFKTKENKFSLELLKKLTENEEHKCDLKKTKDVDTCDDNWGQQNDKIVSNQHTRTVACGYGHSALIRNGSVYTWGHTSRGCLGNGPTMSRHSAPGPNTWLCCFKLEVASVACGRYHTLALTDNGLYCWGSSEFGQLGLGDVQQSPHPRLVTRLADNRVIAIACGQYHTLAVTQEGRVFTWGWGVHGQLGHASVDDCRTPKLVRRLNKLVVVDAVGGHCHSLVLTDNGQVWAFGSSVFGQLGIGNCTKSSIPVHVEALPHPVSQITTGYFHNLALASNNVLFTWGLSPQCLRLQSQAYKRARMQNQSTPVTSPTTVQTVDFTTAAAGDSSSSNQQQYKSNSLWERSGSELHLFPSVVDTRNITERIVQISVGCHHSAVVTESGCLYTWGRSLDGQLGNGSRREVPLPALVSNVKVDLVCCGCEFTVAQEKNTGKLYGWGSNSLGQLGLAVRESTSKTLDGKLVMLKTVRRVVRLPDGGSNVVEEPRLLPDIPSIVFTYQTLNKQGYVSDDNKCLNKPANKYDPVDLAHFITKFYNVINPAFILSKCLDYQNYQAASKVCYLQNKYKLSLIYQLKSFQNSFKVTTTKMKTLEQTPDERVSPATPGQDIHLFTIQGGEEEMCECGDSQEPSTKSDLSESAGDDCPEVTALPANVTNSDVSYMEQALAIVDFYVELAQTANELKIDQILETIIQFWTADKLDFNVLEAYIEKNFEIFFYPLGVLLFCDSVKIKEGITHHKFSTGFLLKIMEYTMKYIEKDGDCSEYLTALCDVMKLNNTATTTRKRKSKQDNLMRLLTDQLKTIDSRHVNKVVMVSGVSASNADNLYVFSCGHYYDRVGYVNKFNQIKHDKVVEEYNKLLEGGDNCLQMACPVCFHACLTA